MVEDADLQQVVTRTTEPATLAELYTKWILPKLGGSGINKTATPNAFPGGPHREVGAAAEPITPTEGDPITSQQLPAAAPSGAFPSVCLDPS